MFPNTVQYKLRRGELNEWKLWACFDGYNDWRGIKRWKTKPSQKTVEDAKTILSHGMEMYQNAVLRYIINLLE